MTGGKKWLTVLTEEHHEWLKEVISKTGLKGSDVVREMFDKIMEDDKKFIGSLETAQLKIKLQEYNDKISALEDAKREIQKQYRGDKVVA